MNLPMPNEEFDNGVVVASMWLNDDMIRVLVLLPEAPFYRIVEAENDEINYRLSYENIFDAATDYNEG